RVTAFDRDGVHQRRGRPLASPSSGRDGIDRLDLGPMTSSLTRDEHADAVAAIHELLRARECYQVNLTRRLHSPVAVDAPALFAAVATHSPAPHATLVQIGDVAVVSASPERFVRREGRWIESAPIKGTHVDATRLRASAKDAAEHVMIVDLTRNDLGRV